MENRLCNKRVQAAVEIGVSVFGLFVLYQILRKMVGGSWGVEELILGLIVVHIGFTFALAMKTTEANRDLRHITKQFESLAIDFKKHREDFRLLDKKVELSLKQRK